MTGLLRYARSQNVTLAQNAAHQFAARHALLHYHSGAIYNFIPKNACSTLRYSLARANGAIASDADFGWIHYNNSTFSAPLPDLVRAPYSFVVLRCPYSRLSSLFLDKFVGLWTPVLNHLRKAAPGFVPNELTFRQFLTHLEAPELFAADTHWRPQIDFLVFEDYSDWFSLEKFRSAATAIETNTGMKVLDTRTLSNHSTNRFDLLRDGCYADTPVRELIRLQRTGACPAHETLYDATLIAAVDRLYAADLQLYRDKFGDDTLLFASNRTKATMSAAS